MMELILTFWLLFVHTCESCGDFLNQTNEPNPLIPTETLDVRICARQVGGPGTPYDLRDEVKHILDSRWQL